MTAYTYSRPASVDAPGHGVRSCELETLWDHIDFLNNPPMVQLRQSTLQAVTTGTFTPITFTTEDFDNYGGHDNSTNPSRYTCQVAGRYQLSGKISWAANAAGQRASQWYVNGTGLSGSQAAIEPDDGAGAIPGHPAVTMTALLSVGDYVELVGFQDAAASLNTSVANAQVQSIMVVRWIGFS